MTKTDLDAKLSSLNRKITKNETDHLLVQNELKKLETLDLSSYNGKSYFEQDGTPNYLIFQPISRYFKITANTKFISSWKSKGLSNETITPYATSDNSLTHFIDRYDTRIRFKFNKGCLKQSNKLIYGYGHIVNVYIVYELGASGSNDNNPSLQKLFIWCSYFNKKRRFLKIWLFWFWCWI